MVLGFSIKSRTFASWKQQNNNNSNKNDQAEDYGREELAELLRKEFPTNGLSVEIVLTRPDDVIKFMRGLSGRSEDIYFDIIGNKIKE